MNILEDVIDSTPIVGHSKGIIHYMTGDSEKGNKAMYKATRTSAVIGGATAGAMLGPGGAVAGAVYGGAAADTLASIATNEEQGYIKYTDELVKDLKYGRDPSKALIRTGVQVGFDAWSGVGIDGTSTVGEEILKRSVYMTRNNFSEKVTKCVLKHSIQDSLKYF